MCLLFNRLTRTISEQQSQITKTLANLRSEGVRLRADQTQSFDELSRQLQSTLEKVESIPHRAVQTLNGTSDNDGRDITARGSSGRPNSFAARYPTDVTNLENILSNLRLTGKDLEQLEREQRFLRSLNYVSRPYRHESIPEAHKSTFKWLFANTEHSVNQNGEQSSRSHRKFRDWLETGNGTFWVSGKAGSGKSTLMKYVASHHKTLKALEEWSGSKEIIIASHFFWSTGTAMQKSMKGLLQELLYDILCQCPGLAPDLFPLQWEETRSQTFAQGREWPIEALFQGLRSLSDLSTVSFKGCFFIDGLDEYDGDYFELCQILKQLSSSSKFKCCLSSRPWNVFDDAFAADPSRVLCVNELTHRDIRNYSQSRLMELPKWNRVFKSEAQLTNFAGLISERAQGVFLWVFLVINSLRDGLINGDTITDFQRRLDALPSDLESMFKHMLNQVDPFYHQYMSETIQMTIHAKYPLQLLIYCAREHEDHDINYALERPIDRDFALTRESRGLLKPCRRRINARCGGLLCFNDGRVEFLHRTVRDFLLTGPMQEFLGQGVRPQFKVNLSTLKALVFLLRCALSTENNLENAEDLRAIWKQTMRYANDAIEEDDAEALNIIDWAINVPQDGQYWGSPCCRNAIPQIFKDYDILTDDGMSHEPARRRSRHGLALLDSSSQESIDRLWRHTLLVSGVEGYIVAKLRKEPEYFGSTKSPLGTIIHVPIWRQGHLRAISGLLETGIDPNEKDESGLTHWQSFLKAIMETDSYGRGRCRCDISAVESVFSAFLRNGAHRIRKMTHLGHSHYPLTHLLLYGGEQWGTETTTKIFIVWIDLFLAGTKKQTQLQLEDMFNQLSVQSRWFSGTGKQKNGAKVLERLIQRGSDTGIDMSTVMVQIPRHFDVWWTQRLCSLITGDGQRIRSAQPNSSLLKRPRDIDSGQGYSNKRARSENETTHKSPIPKSEEQIWIQLD